MVTLNINTANTNKTDMATKLARQMAYKKKLEEEFRLAEERRKYERKSKYYEHKSCMYEAWNWENSGKSRRRNSISDSIIEETRLKERENESKEIEERKNAQYEKEKKDWMKKRDTYMERAAKFADLKRKRLEEKARIEESKKYIKEEEDIWEAFESIIRENETALKDLEDYKVTVENKEREEKEKLELEQKLRDSVQNSTDVYNIAEPNAFDNLSDIEKRIKELELSIASLDDQLERFEIEKMNCKTREVKKRMSIATNTCAKLAPEVLDPGSVSLFLEDDTLWEK